MDSIDSLIPFSRLRQLRARGISQPINQRSGSDNLMIYEGLIPIERYVKNNSYFLLNQRYVFKLHQKSSIKDAFYDFIVFDLWSEKEM
jgi:hypothetical protein